MISTVENIQTRLLEIEYVFFPTISHETNVTKENLNDVLQFKDKFDQICSQIDNLESLVSRVKGDLTKIERQMDIAEEELKIPAKSSTMNFLINMNIRKKVPLGSNIGENGKYEHPDIFKTSDYFTDADKKQTN